MRPFLIVSSALTLIAASSTALAQSRLTSDLNGQSSYGQFLAGRVAMTRGDGQQAVDYFARALAGSNGELILRERALSAAILAGDVRTAANVSLTAEESNANFIEAVRLARIALAINDGRARSINAEIRSAPIQAPHALAGRLVARWLAADAGDWATATAPVSEGGDALTHILSGYYRAALLERRRQFEQADAQYRELMLDGTAGAMMRLPYGEFLERRGRRDDAIAVYDSGLAQGADPALSAARARAATRGRAPEMISIRDGAALAFSHAAAAASVSNMHEFVVAYLRLSTMLNPDDGESWLMLGEALNEIGMAGSAREAWNRILADQPERLEAQIRIASSLGADGEGEAALQVARAVADGEPGPASAFTLAAILNSHEQYAEALTVLDSPHAVAEENWGLLFLRAAAHERRGEIPQAEAAFLAALELAPDQPEILNYLGYMWVDRGGRVEEGLAMIERAVAAEPQNGNYQDSLGWARYRLGQYDEAARLLELAVTLEPGSGVINDHLGDAYWQVGRTREAEFQWRRALTLDLNESERQAVQVKLAGNPPSTTP